MNNFRCAQISILAVALTLTATVNARSQTTTPSSAALAVNSDSNSLPQSSLDAFAEKYNVQVVQSTTPIAAAQYDSAPPTERLRQLQKLAAESGVTYQKVYTVSPASVSQPVTSYTAAQQMADQNGLVSLNVSDIPAASAMRIIAAADNATIKFTDGGPTASVNIDLMNTTVPQAIATIAARTHTHWQAAYMLAPIAGADARTSRLAYAATPVVNQQQYEATQLFNGPYTMHFAPIQPVLPVKPPVAPPNRAAVAGAAAAGAADAANAAANAADATASAANAAANSASAAANAANGAYPGYSPYGPYYYGNAPYGYNPYADGTAGYSPYGYSPYGYGGANGYSSYGYSSSPYGYSPYGYGSYNPYTGNSIYSGSGTIVFGG